MNKDLQSIIMIAGLLFAAGCNQAPVRDPKFASVRPALPAEQAPANGAIYQAGYDMRLYEDLKARRIGDILTVLLVEETDASKSAETETERSTNTDIDNPTIFGASPRFDLPGFLPLDSTNNLSLESRLRSEHDFEGSGSSSQQNSLSGSLTVSVVEVLPNGNLVIRGEKRLQLNTGNEYIRLSGIVRSVDISTNNTVLSTSIADATIMYTGDGPVAETNFVGWLARFFGSAIFPF